MQKLFSITSVYALVALMHTAFCASTEAQWGTIKGQVLLDGEIPQIPLLVKRGNLANKDAAICAAHDIPDEKLVVDPKTKGISNIVIYLAKKPVNVHPDLAQSRNKEVTIDQKGCLYVPHVMLVRTDQRVRVLSDDAVFHSTHTHPIKNDLENFVMAPNDRTGVVLKTMKLAERVPTKVTCDIHHWTSAYMMVLDNPYAAVTDQQGNFEITNLPVGTHQFKVWHESSGLLVKRLAITIQEGANEQKPMKYSAAQILK